MIIPPKAWPYWYRDESEVNHFFQKYFGFYKNGHL